MLPQYGKDTTMVWVLHGLWLLLCLGFCPKVECYPPRSGLEDIIKALHEKIIGKQYTGKESEKYQKGGYYETLVTFDTYGSSEMVFLRHAMKLADNSMFVSAVITKLLLELSEFGPLTPTEVNNMELTLISMNKSKSHYVEGEHSLLTFWEEFVDDTGKWRGSYVGDLTADEHRDLVNMMVPILLKTGFDEVELQKALRGIFGVRQSIPQLAVEKEQIMEKNPTIYLSPLAGEKKGMSKVGICLNAGPPDFDDTLVNIAIGTLLKKYSTLYPHLYDLWCSLHPNATESTIDALKTYAYRPLSTDANVNTIATKSYFFVRDFLQYRRDQGDEDIAIVTAWASNQDDIILAYARGQVMVTLNNDIDLVVCANVVTDVIMAVSNGLWDPSVLDDQDFQNLFLDTFDLLVYAIRTHFSGKMIYSSPYYALEYQLYWWMARMYSHLEDSIRQNGKPAHKIFNNIYIEVRSVMRTVLTKLILEEGHSDHHGGIYYDDFTNYLDDADVTPQTVVKVAEDVREKLFTTLGSSNTDQSDRDKDGWMDSYVNEMIDNTIKDVTQYTKTGYEDRILTTATAAIILISTWTYCDVTSGKLLWDDDTPHKVVSVVNSIVAWLYRNTLSGEYRPGGAIFTGVPMTPKMLPQKYPFNVNRYVNGTERHDTDIIGFDGILGVSGIIPEAEYQKKIKELWGYDDWINKPHAYRDPDIVPNMIVWSSDAHTYAAALTAFAKYAAILE